MKMQQKRPFRIGIGYLTAVVGIYLTTTIAWLILGAVTDQRTSRRDETLRQEVGQLWGGVHRHVAPAVVVPADSPLAAATPSSIAASRSNGAQGESSPAQPVKLPAPAPSTSSSSAPGAKPDPCALAIRLEPTGTRAQAGLELEHRQKGLLWYSTYRVDFDGTYTFTNPTACTQEALLVVPFPARGAAYDEFQLLLDGSELAIQTDAEAVYARKKLEPGKAHRLRVRYTSRGLDRWSYAFGANTARARDFQLLVHTNFDKVDFPTGSLSPVAKRRTDRGWDLTWRFGNLLSEAGIAVAMPQKLNPGPLAAEISRFAPVSLAFFFFVLLLVSVMKQIRLHPVHYALLASAFFAFHLLFTYLVDLVPLSFAFTAASVTSVGLVVSYLRLAVGPRFALLWAGGAQLLYLVLFSLAFFFEGYTGLSITIFSILTLFVVMQLTARIDWFGKFGAPEPVEVTILDQPAPVAASNVGPNAGAGEKVFSRLG
jgi:hypothetical protein